MCYRWEEFNRGLWSDSWLVVSKSNVVLCMVPGKVLTWKRVDFADRKEGLTQGGAEFLLSGGFCFLLTKKRPESVLKREDVRREESCLTCVVVFEPVWFCFTCVVVLSCVGSCIWVSGWLSVWGRNSIVYSVWDSNPRKTYVVSFYCVSWQAWVQKKRLVLFELFWP